MLTSHAQSIFSWKFTVGGAAEGPAEVALDFLGENGTIRLGGAVYYVRKQGWMSGRWQLTAGGKVLAEAYKPDPFFRTFEVRIPSGKFTLKAQSPFTRAFNLLSGDRVCGTIQTRSIFTRSATINCERDIPELAQLFCFWLALLCWRRASNNGGGAT